MADSRSPANTAGAAMGAGLAAHIAEHQRRELMPRERDQATEYPAVETRRDRVACRHRDESFRTFTHTRTGDGIEPRPQVSTGSAQRQE